jgi:predicted nucleic acid-binding protein
MSKTPVFLDTAALLALANKRDALHQQAKAERNRITAENQAVLTTESVRNAALRFQAKQQAKKEGAKQRNGWRGCGSGT